MFYINNCNLPCKKFILKLFRWTAVLLVRSLASENSWAKSTLSHKSLVLGQYLVTERFSIFKVCLSLSSCHITLQTGPSPLWGSSGSGSPRVIEIFGLCTWAIVYELPQGESFAYSHTVNADMRQMYCYRPELLALFGVTGVTVLFVHVNNNRLHFSWLLI